MPAAISTSSETHPIPERREDDRPNSESKFGRFGSYNVSIRAASNHSPRPLLTENRHIWRSWDPWQRTHDHAGKEQSAGRRLNRRMARPYHPGALTEPSSASS